MDDKLQSVGNKQATGKRHNAGPSHHQNQFAQFADN
jgi:hypothetical protein